MSEIAIPRKIPMSIKISPLAHDRMVAMCKGNGETRIGVIERGIHVLWEQYLAELKLLREIELDKSCKKLGDEL